MSQETLLDKWKRAFDNTIWSLLFSVIVGLGTIIGAVKICNEFIYNPFRQGTNETVKVNLSFEKDGKFVKGVTILTPKYFKKTGNGSFEGLTEKPLPEKIYIKYYTDGATETKEDEAFSTDSSNYIIYIK